MTEKRTAAVAQFISSEFNRVLTLNALPVDHPIRAELDKSADVVVGFGDPYVVVSDGRGGRASLSQRVPELKDDPRFAGSFARLPKVNKNDVLSLRSNFAKIAAGEMIVE